MSAVSSFARVRAKRWFKLVWLIPLALLVLFALVLIARGLRDLPVVRSFMSDYSGASALPTNAPVGFPWWVDWQHGLNAFFLLFVVRSGWQIRKTERPPGHWVRNNNGPIKTKNPPVRIRLDQWFHLTVDTLWVTNGIVFYFLIFSTGQWMRLVPTRWDVFPNAVSAGLQYASLEWPTENGWSNYNALQILSYFLVVFVAAPLAITTGLRMAPGLSLRFKHVERIFPIAVARRLHFPVLVFLVAFVIIHVTLVLATGALNNLNHMYATRNDNSWVGFWIFAGSIALMVAAWVAARPVLLRSVASLTGSVSR